MNYRGNYFEYIAYVQTLARKKHLGIHYERHHILPRCLGGSDDLSNLVILTVREHFLAHYLLCKIYEGTADHFKMLNAFMAMSWGRKGVRSVNSRLVSKAKAFFVENKAAGMLGVRIQPEGYKHSANTKAKMSRSRQGKTPALGLRHSEETKKKIREKLTAQVILWNDAEGVGKRVLQEEVSYWLDRGYRLGGHPEAPEKRKEFLAMVRAPRSEAHKQSISKAQKGKAKSPEHIQKIKEAIAANPRKITEEMRRAASERAKGKVWIHKDGISRMCKPETILLLLEEGWLRGRS